MVTLRLPSSIATPWTCSNCTRQQQSIRRALRVVLPSASSQKRRITHAYTRKAEEARKQWDKRHEQIKVGELQSILSILEERGFVHAIAGLAGFSSSFQPATDRTGGNVMSSMLCSIENGWGSMWASILQHRLCMLGIWFLSWRFSGCTFMDIKP